MRILVLCTDAYGGHGGIALYNRDLIEALAQLPGCDEVVVVPRIVPREPGPIPPGVSFVREAATGASRYAKAVLRLSRERFDLVICGHVNLLRLMRLFHAPKLLFTYGIDAWKPWRRNAAQQLDAIDGVVSISDITLSRMVDWSGFAKRTYLLPNAIHAERYGIRPPSEDVFRRLSFAGKRVLLTVGRLVAAERYKGFDEVIELLPDLPGDIVYVAAGGGDDLPRLRNKAERCGVGDRVRFTGDFPESMKPDLYATSDVYVMPSRGEGFGFVFLEALASGLPAIGSKHDGGREALLGGELGLLVDPSNPAELRQAILEQLEAPKTIPSALATFAFQRFVERTHAIISDYV